MRDCCNGSDPLLHSGSRGSIPLSRTIFMKSRVNKAWCTPESLREAVATIKWSKDFYKKECARIRGDVANSQRQTDNEKMVG